MFKVILSLLNGQKLNTGTVIILATFLLEKVLGTGHDEATQIVSGIMYGVGGVTALIGYIHKWIKAAKEKK